jgi:transcriptional regulator with XRE-family HTH domain
MCIFWRWQACMSVVGSLYDSDDGTIVNTDKVAFGARLRTLRVAAGFQSARLFAEALGVNENTYSRYERGQSAPDFHLLQKICKRLNITPNDLFSGAGTFSGQQNTLHDHPGISDAEAEPSQIAAAKSRKSPVTFPGRQRDTSQPNQPDELSILTWRFAEAYSRAVLVHGRLNKPKDQKQSEFVCLQESAKLFMRLRADLLPTIARLVVSEQLSKATPDERARVQQAADDLLRTAMRTSDSTAA